MNNSQPFNVHLEVVKFSNHFVNDVGPCNPTRSCPSHVNIGRPKRFTLCVDPLSVWHPLAMSYFQMHSQHQNSQHGSNHKVADPTWVFSKCTMIMRLVYENTPNHYGKMGNVPQCFGHVHCPIGIVSNGGLMHQMWYPSWHPSQRTIFGPSPRRPHISQCFECPL